jgi:hypothetical protein
MKILELIEYSLVKFENISQKIVTAQPGRQGGTKVGK